MEISNIIIIFILVVILCLVLAFIHNFMTYNMKLSIKIDKQEDFRPHNTSSSLFSKIFNFKQISPIFKPKTVIDKNSCEWKAKRNIDIAECVKKSIKDEIKKEISDEVTNQIKDTESRLIEEFHHMQQDKIRDKSELTDKESQMGYYQLYSDIEKSNDLNPYVMLNLPIGGDCTKKNKLMADVSCKKCVGSPNDYYLKYKPQQFNNNEYDKIKGSNINNYIRNSEISEIENDDLTGLRRTKRQQRPLQPDANNE